MTVGQRFKEKGPEKKEEKKEWSREGRLQIIHSLSGFDHFCSD
jgi:hypothetical protein